MIRKKTRKIVRKTSSTKNYQRKSLLSLVQKKEFWAGVLTVLVLVVLASKIPFKSAAQNIGSYRIKIVKVTPTIYKNPAKVSVTSVVSPTQAVVNTASREYVIQTGDSYATATSKVCGDQKFYVYNQELNQNKELQIGDSVLIRCNWE